MKKNVLALYFKRNSCQIGVWEIKVEENGSKIETHEEKVFEVDNYLKFVVMKKGERILIN